VSRPTGADGAPARPVVRAAGGVVWRRTDDTVEVVLVHRPAPRDDWSFPKGKLDPGERHRDAALREVEEETGLACRLGSKLCEVAYVTPRGEDKRVRWWAMTVDEDRGFRPNDEIDGLRWVPIDRAGAELTHPSDRQLVHALVTSGDLDRA
jgi:8-oxo-dGTP diphosphatase